MVLTSSMLVASAAERYGERVGEMVHIHQQSFNWKSHMLDYHKNECFRLFDLLQVKLPGGPAHSWDLIHQRFADPQLHHYRKLSADCHLLAATQCLHSMFDLVAHYVYWAMNLESVRQLEAHEVNFGRVRALAGGVVGRAMQLAVSGPDYDYLNGFVNTIKHRRLVDRKISVESGRSGIKIGPFDYGCQTIDGESRPISYPAKWADQLLLDLAPVYSRLVDVSKAIENDLLPDT